MTSVSINCPHCNSRVKLDGNISQVWKCNRCSTLFGIESIEVIKLGDYTAERQHPFPLTQPGDDKKSDLKQG